MPRMMAARQHVGPDVQPRARAMGLFRKCFLSFSATGFQTELLQCGMWPIFAARFAEEPSQSLLPGGFL